MLYIAGSKKLLKDWELIFASPTPSPGRLHSCDHIVELNFIKAFFASPPMQKPKYQDIWKELTNPGDKVTDQ
ncbi:MAG: hypothetical protein Q9183_003142, partial [Haloplaca sp. 2 TL-2023]